MAEFQTTVQDPGAILRGSGLVDIAPISTLGAAVWTNVGAVQGLSATENLEVNAEENDNTDSEDKVTKQTVTVAFTQMEPLSDEINTLIRGALDTRTATAGAPVAGATQTATSGNWGYNSFIQIENQNGDGTVPTVNSVTGSTDGALVEDTDFFVGESYDGSGIWGVFIIDSATVTTEVQDMTIDYDYTPNASVKWQSGDKSDLTKFMVRITTKNDGNTYTSIFYYCNISSGKTFEYSKDDDEDRRVGTPVEFVAKNLPNGQGDAANEDMVWQSVQVSGF